jgi:hypothetical protein
VETLFHFRGVRGNVFRFYQTHFVPDGVLHKQLGLARAAAADVEMEGPVRVGYQGGISGEPWHDHIV